MSDNLTPLKIKDLFGNSNKYSIPIYQRNYAWGEKEITQLIQDIVDYALKYPDKSYYIGTLIVYEKKNEELEQIYETIDGQQRLTTLTILLSVLKNKQEELSFRNDMSWFKLNLSFDSRINSTETLKGVYSNKIDNNNSNSDIKYAYIQSLKILERILKEYKLNVVNFCNYLFEKVMILRVPVPKDTDLNHYFEIMNSRGEQLEKHEVLKAKCLKYLSEEDYYGFNLIWESCANMEKYVQYGFSVEERNLIFGKDNWNNLQIDSFDGLTEKLKQNNNETLYNKNGFTIIDLLKPVNPITKKPSINNENPDRFNSVINFSNFLLHVLRIQEKKDAIALDDKRLLDLFINEIENASNKVAFVKTFAFNLLKLKFLFDKYIIKREFLNGTDNWSLKRLKWYVGNNVSYVNSFSIDDINENDAENKNVLMLLSMFHVSTPTLVYKHWLNAALKYVFENKDINTKNYINYLENLGESFLIDRYLANEPSRGYYEIIYTNNGESKNKDIDISKLDKGTSVENFIFNFLDYKLWKNNAVANSENFKFTFRSSVEHYYPQQPMEGLLKLEQSEVDKFGNLCLLSNNTNSRLWNLPPDGKKTYFKETNSYESLKQKIMMIESDWTLIEIAKHGQEMKEILLSPLALYLLQTTHNF